MPIDVKIKKEMDVYLGIVSWWEPAHLYVWE